MRVGFNVCVCVRARARVCARARARVYPCVSLHARMYEYSSGAYCGCITAAFKIKASPRKLCH